MNVRVIFRHLTAIIFVILAQTLAAFAQKTSCDLQANVFLLHKSDYPQDTPIKNARATLVDLDTNAALNSRSLGGTPYFANLPAGRYNLVVGKQNYGSTIKQINLDCRFTDEKNVFKEIVFLTDKPASENYRMYQVELKVADDFPSPPAPPSPNTKISSSMPQPLVIAPDIAVNERAVYLPSPIFPAQIETLKNKLLTELTAFVIPVNVEIDKNGSVVAASADSRFEELIPYIVESAKKSKFVPVKINGRSVALRGRLNYNFSK